MFFLPARHGIPQTTDLKQDWGGGGHATGRKGALRKTAPPSFEFLIMGHDFPKRMSLN